MLLMCNIWKICIARLVETDLFVVLIKKLLACLSVRGIVFALILNGCSLLFLVNNVTNVMGNLKK